MHSVLLVEDNPGDARLVREALRERFGERVRLDEADTLAAAFDALDARAIDVVLLDLGLPDSHGLDTLRRLRARAPGMPVVVLTGHDDDEQAVAAVRAGAQAYVAKQRAHTVELVRSLRQAIERRTLEQALRDSEARYRTIVETAEEGILLVDASARVRFANARMGHMLGVSLADLPGRAFVDLVAPAHREAAAQLLVPVPGLRRSGELLLAHGAQQVPVLAAAGNLLAPEGGWLETVVMLTDLSGLKRAEAELERIRQRLEQRVAERTVQLEAARSLNATLAHDLRAPLNAITGSASLLDMGRDGPLNDAQRHHLGMIRDGAREMDELIGALLRLAQAAGAPLQRTTVDVSAMVHELAMEVGALHSGRAVQWQIEPGAVAYADPELLRNALRNLLDNALKYSADAQPARVAFETRRSSAGQTVYCVRDNGVGFAMASAGRLFEPLQRLPSAFGTDGSGVGLAAVRRIVERHGGSVWAESTPGEGSVFFFTLAAPGGADNR